jgi:hypothetical protein
MRAAILNASEPNRPAKWSFKMAFDFRFSALLLPAACSFGAPVWAASSASSAASDSVTTLLGSVSNSLGRSSDSSKGGDKTAAAGDYEIIEITEVADAQVATLRLKLQALADNTAADDALYLYLPRAAFEQGQLRAGHIVTATPRPYGIEFAKLNKLTATREAFFLVLHDEWYRDLQTQVVAL